MPLPSLPRQFRWHLAVGPGRAISGLEPWAQLEAFLFRLWLGQKSSWPRPGLLGPSPRWQRQQLPEKQPQRNCPTERRGAIKPYTALEMEPGTPLRLDRHPPCPQSFSTFPDDPGAWGGIRYLLLNFKPRSQPRGWKEGEPHTQRSWMLPNLPYLRPPRQAPGTV